jgi:pantothenate kinase type III
MSTEESIVAGVNEGIAGGVARIVARFRRLYDHDTRVLVTGGAWELVASEELRYTHVPDATLVGAALAATVK